MGRLLGEMQDNVDFDNDPNGESLREERADWARGYSSHSSVLMNVITKRRDLISAGHQVLVPRRNSGSPHRLRTVNFS